jgi:predicted molibdopterin-dependent oxidoreductase YjgC
MLPVALSRRLGTHHGRAPPPAIQDEVAALAPSHAGLDAQRLAVGDAHDGLLTPLPVAPAHEPAPATDEAEIDEAPNDADTDEVHDGADEPPPGPERPPVLEWTAPPTADAPAVDAYSLRLVASRRLYDQGTEVQHAPGLAALAAPTGLRLHPYDFDRLGVEPGTTVTLTAATGSAVLPVHPDDRVGRGAAAVIGAQDGPHVGALIDATAVVTEVRVEEP